MKSILYVIVYILILYTKVCKAYEVNIYDSASRKDYVVIEYIDDRGKAFRLLVKQEDLRNDTTQVENWIDNMRQLDR